jgi:hypothetical protein
MQKQIEQRYPTIDSEGRAVTYQRRRPKSNFTPRSAGFVPDNSTTKNRVISSVDVRYGLSSFHWQINHAQNPLPDRQIPSWSFAQVEVMMRKFFMSKAPSSLNPWILIDLISGAPSSLQRLERSNFSTRIQLRWLCSLNGQKGQRDRSFTLLASILQNHGSPMPRLLGS